MSKGSRAAPDHLVDCSCWQRWTRRGWCRQVVINLARELDGCPTQMGRTGQEFCPLYSPLGVARRGRVTRGSQSTLKGLDVVVA